MPPERGSEPGERHPRAAAAVAAVAAEPPGPGNPADPDRRGAAVHITNTRAVSQTSVLLRDARIEASRCHSHQVGIACVCDVRGEWGSREGWVRPSFGATAVGPRRGGPRPGQPEAAAGPEGRRGGGAHGWTVRLNLRPRGRPERRPGARRGRVPAVVQYGSASCPGWRRATLGGRQGEARILLTAGNLPRPHAGSRYPVLAGSSESACQAASESAIRSEIRAAEAFGSDSFAAAPATGIHLARQRLIMRLWC